MSDDEQERPIHADDITWQETPDGLIAICEQPHVWAILLPELLRLEREWKDAA